MNANEYQELAGRTLIDGPGFELTDEEAKITYVMLDLVTNVGEIADLVKKGIYHRHGFDKVSFLIFLERAKFVIGQLEEGCPDAEPMMPSAKGTMLAWNALGLAGEAGEAVLHASDMAFRRDVNIPLLSKELGDTLWYIAAICSKVGLSLEEVMSQNIAKLKKRYPDGYSTAASIERVDSGERGISQAGHGWEVDT